MAAHRKNKLQIYPQSLKEFICIIFIGNGPAVFLINYVFINTLKFHYFLITMVLYINYIGRYIHIILRKSHYDTNFQNKYHLIIDNTQKPQTLIMYILIYIKHYLFRSSEFELGGRQLT